MCEYIYIYIYMCVLKSTLGMIGEYFTQALADGCPLEADSKSPQNARTLPSILADLNNAVVWMVSNRLLIYMFSPPVPFFGDCTEYANYNWYYRHFHVPQFFFNSLASSTYLPLFSPLFSFTQWSVLFGRFSFLLLLLLTISRSGRLAEIR